MRFVCCATSLAELGGDDDDNNGRQCVHKNPDNVHEKTYLERVASSTIFFALAMFEFICSTLRVA